MLVVRRSKSQCIYHPPVFEGSRVLDVLREHWGDEPISSLPLGFPCECGNGLALAFRPGSLSKLSGHLAKLDFLYIGLPSRLSARGKISFQLPRQLLLD